MSPLLEFPCSFAPGTARARSFCTHERSRPPNPQFLSTTITKIDGSCSSSSDWRCAVAGRAFVTVTSVNTHPRGLPLRGFLSHHGTKTTWTMAFPRINCRTTTATVLTATAASTLSLRACLYLFLSHHLSQVHRRQTPTSSSYSGRATLVSSVKTRHISWSSLSG